MRTSRPRNLAKTVATIGAVAFFTGCGGSPSSPSPTEATMLTFNRPANQFVGPESGTYTRATATFEAHIRSDVRGSYLSAQVRPTNGSICQLFLAAPQNQTLGVGTYPNAIRWPAMTSTTPAIDFGCGSGCNTLDGSFNIRRLSVNSAGDVERLEVSFEQTCHRFNGIAEERMATLSGILRIIPNQ